MPLSRLLSRRSGNKTDCDSKSSSRSLSNSLRSSMSFSKSAQRANPDPYASTSGPPPASNPIPQQPASQNPFTSAAAPPTRRRPKPPQASQALGGDAPPAYNDLVTQTPDDPYAFLSNFDTVFLIDDSGSMAGRSWRETAAALAAIAPICTARDHDGVDVHFLNNRTPHLNLTTAQAVQAIFETTRPAGQTFTGTRLRHILKPYLDRVQLALSRGSSDGSGAPVEIKPLNIIVITDGQASDDVEAVVLEAARKLDRIEAPAWQVGIQFFQVGREPGAAEALQELDDDLVAAGCPRDIVDTVPWNKGDGTEAGLSADGVLKVVLGSVNRKLDRKRVSGEAARK